jgi:hypothetical protein
MTLCVHSHFTYFAYSCSICTRKAFVHLFIEPDDFKLLTPKDNIQEYHFNTKKARHMFCKHCGIHSHYIARSHPDHIDINLRCVDDIELVKTIKKEYFDGANWESSIGDLNPDNPEVAQDNSST